MNRSHAEATSPGPREHDWLAASVDACATVALAVAGVTTNLAFLLIAVAMAVVTAAQIHLALRARRLHD